MTLPKGWTKAKLGEFTVERVEQGEPRASAVPYIDIGSIDRDLKSVGPTEKVTRANAPTRARQWVKSGDVLVSLTRPNLNAVAMVPPELEGAVASTGFDVLRPKGVLPEWVFNRVRSQLFVSDVCEGVQGVVYPAIRPADVRQHDLPIPPVQEQRRIVDSIDSHLTRLDDAVASLERVQVKLKAYRASVLKAALEGRLVPTEASLAAADKREYEPAEVLLARILEERRRRWEDAELAKLKAAGKKPKDDKWKARYQGPPVPTTSKLPDLPVGWCWASPGQVFSWASGEFLPKKAQRDGPIPVFGGNGVNGFHNKELIEAPTIVVGRVGAQCGNLHLTVGPSWITDNAIYAVAPVAEVNLGFWLISMGRQNLNANAGGTGQPYVNQRHLNELRVPLPPASEQSRIVAVADALLSKAEHTEKEISLSILRCTRLRQAVLKWAFEGKLVDQDPSDEPADKLLARIRAERGTAASSKKARGRTAKGAA